MVFYALEKAKKEGKIQKDTVVIEGSSGNTGTSVAAYCAVNNLKCIIVMSKKVSNEKVNSVKAFGAEVVLTEVTQSPDDENSYYNVVARIVKETKNSFHLNQYHNEINIEAHYNTTAKELYNQIKNSDKKIDAIFIGAGTCGTILGIAKYFKEQKSNIKIIGVESNSNVLTNYIKNNKIISPTSTRIEGINFEFITDFVKKEFQNIDDITSIDDIQAFEMCRYLTKTNAVFAGGSSGAVVAATINYLNKHNLNWNVITIMPDSGIKYLSKIYNES
jgi:cystathionine beta-synthase